MEVTCPTCGVEFYPLRRGHIFCTPSCGARARARQRLDLPIADADQPPRPAPPHKISAEDVAQMCALYAQGVTQLDIAASWGIHKDTVNRLIRARLLHGPAAC